MRSMTGIMLFFTFLNFFVFILCAPKLPAGDSYGIVATEWAIRDTLNNLFFTLKLKAMQQKLKFKQYSTIHNFFVSITLRDNDNLKKIAKLTQVDNIDNGTQVFITQLNEVLSDDNKSDEATDSVYVKILIEEFVNRLDDLKERNGLQNNTKFDLNKAILKYLSTRENVFGNTTFLKEEHTIGNYSEDNVLGSIESWQPSGRRIFGGTRSNIKRFPFMASVQFFKKFQCGGSIIKSDLVITSASCLQLAWNNRFFRENPAFLSVQVGSTLYERGGENIPIMEVNFHPSYNPKNLRHNLALLRLTRKLKLSRKGNSKLKKINFDRSPSPLPTNVDGIVIVGWGARTFGTNIVSLWKNELSFSTLDFYPLVECQEIYTKEFVTERNFCAGFFSKGGGACNHDAGGPGVSSGTLIGVISFGSPACGTPDAPTVFTKLGYYTDWINGIMEKKMMQADQLTTHRVVTFPTFDLPSFKKTTPFKVMPITFKNPSKVNRFESLRTTDKKHEFRDFLKTMFKKKKQQKEEDEQEQQEETEEASQLFEDKPEDEKELNISEIKQLLRNKPVTEIKKEKERKPSISKPKKKLKHIEKIKTTTESQSQSKEDYIDETTTIPIILLNTEINQAEVTSLRSVYDVSAPITPSFNQQNDRNEETSSSQEKDFDEAIENLLDNLNMDYILESKNSSLENQKQVRAKDKLHKNMELNKSNPKIEGTKTKGLSGAKTKGPRGAVANTNRNENKEEKSDANNGSDKGNESVKGDSSKDVGEDEDSFNDESNEQSSNKNQIVEIADKSQSTDNVEDNSNDYNKNEHSEEVLHMDSKDVENKEYETDDGGEINERFEGFNIPAEDLEQEHSSNSTERILEMMEYEDLYKLLMKDI